MEKNRTKNKNEGEKKKEKQRNAVNKKPKKISTREKKSRQFFERKRKNVDIKRDIIILSLGMRVTKEKKNRKKGEKRKNEQ